MPPNAAPAGQIALRLQTAPRASITGAHMLELRRVSKLFSGIAAVDNVSFQAPSGQVTGYLGPNVSGKSTTMKMITGLMEPTSGEILFNGERIQQDLIAHKRRM